MSSCFNHLPKLDSQRQICKFQVCLRISAAFTMLAREVYPYRPDIFSLSKAQPASVFFFCLFPTISYKMDRFALSLDYYYLLTCMALATFFNLLKVADAKQEIKFICYPTAVR